MNAGSLLAGCANHHGVLAHSLANSKRVGLECIPVACQHARHAKAGSLESILDACLYSNQQTTAPVVDTILDYGWSVIEQAIKQLVTQRKQTFSIIRTQTLHFLEVA